MVLDSNNRRESGRIRRNTRGQKTGNILRRHPEYTLLIGFSLCLFLAISMVALPATSAQMGYQIVGLQQELTRLERETARLKLEVSGLESLERIERVARTELGMIEVEQVRTVMVDTAHLHADVQSQSESGVSFTQRFAAGLVTFVARAVAGRPAQAGN